uniref:Uncharacterized protein n=1 Tax=Romanomermis culicivorax TaxID=13658 RepID=A0A915HRF1_ROMCU
MGPATTKIYSNGTIYDDIQQASWLVAQKDIYKIRLYRPLTSSDRGNLKINATITLSDFRYSNRGILMNFPMESGTCLTHSELKRPKQTAGRKNKRPGRQEQKK